MELVKDIRGGLSWGEERARSTRVRTPPIEDLKDATDRLKSTLQANDCCQCIRQGNSRCSTDVNDVSDTPTNLTCRLVTAE
jgi:hypothetical protein